MGNQAQNKGLIMEQLQPYRGSLLGFYGKQENMKGNVTPRFLNSKSALFLKQLKILALKDSGLSLI